MDTNVLLEDSHSKYALLDAVRCTGLGRLLRDPVIRWIALEDPGRQLQ